MDIICDFVSCYLLNVSWVLLSLNKKETGLQHIDMLILYPQFAKMRENILNLCFVSDFPCYSLSIRMTLRFLDYGDFLKSNLRVNSLLPL